MISRLQRHAFPRARTAERLPKPSFAHGPAVAVLATTGAATTGRAPRRAERSSIVVRIARQCGIILASVLVLAVVGAALLLRQTPLGYSELLGHPVLKVVSGSMTPTFRTGDLIVDQPLSTQAKRSLHVGEIVTFQEPGSGGSALVTHRVYRVLSAPGDKYGATAISYETKGDANNAPDVWRVLPSEVVGRYVGRVPDGGFVLAILESRWTLAGGALLLVAWVAAAFMGRAGEISERTPIGDQ